MPTTTLAAPAGNKPTPPPPAVSERLMSLDALRGFDMFWIIGADALVQALNGMSKSAPTGFLARQLDHADWEGFRFYDLIFPLFVFMVGVSLVFSLTRLVETAGRAGALKRIVIRGVLLFALGLFYNGGLSSPWPNLRLMGVLNYIALAYFFAGLLFCFFKPRMLAAVCASLLVGYWAILSFVPIRDIQLNTANLAQLAEQTGDPETAALFRRSGNPSSMKDSPVWAAAEKMFYATTNRVTGKFEKGLNVANHFDFQHLPARKYDVFWDPEGLLGVIGAVAACLGGVLAGVLLRSRNYCDKWKLIYLASFGVAGVLAGFLWGMQLPVIKKIWSPSYVLVAGGYSALLLAAFYLVVDVWKRRTWCQPFVWIGMNAIAVYLASDVISNFGGIATRLVGGDVKLFFDNHVAGGFGEMMIVITSLLVGFLFARFLYKRKIFLRV